MLAMSFKLLIGNHFGWGAHRTIHYKKQNNVQYLYLIADPRANPK
ncbi:hypothetical protein [Heyndrickxia oleronia]|nr:hypothetical protein [Heyndrickxia oleronia]